MKLVDLEPQFHRIEKRTDGTFFPDVDDLASAQGIRFLCPVCFAANAGPVGTHCVIAWFKDRGVPDDETPGPGRWIPSGTGYTDLTLTPSIHLSGEGGCGWHGHVTAGEVT